MPMRQRCNHPPIKGTRVIFLSTALAPCHFNRLQSSVLSILRPLLRDVSAPHLNPLLRNSNLLAAHSFLYVLLHSVTKFGAFSAEPIGLEGFRCNPDLSKSGIKDLIQWPIMHRIRIGPLLMSRIYIGHSKA